MIPPRAVLFLLLSPSFLALTPLGAKPDNIAAATTSFAPRINFAPATPLDDIPVYSLEASSPGALRSLDIEIERLYRHATTLPSGPARRSFETRIYLLEKQLRPLLKDFDTAAWEELRTAVKSEWLDVQSTLPEPLVPAPLLVPSKEKAAALGTKIPAPATS